MERERENIQACLNAAQTVRRNLGQSLEARGFSQEETHDFYRSLKEEKTDVVRLTYKTLRAVLVKKLTERRIKRFASQVEVEWLPASVLLSRGWDQATLDRFEKEHGEESRLRRLQRSYAEAAVPMRLVRECANSIWLLR